MKTIGAASEALTIEGPFGRVGRPSRPSEFRSMSSVDHAANGNRASTPPAVPTATFAEVDISSELDARSCRAPDYERERQTLGRLAAALADNPRDMLQRLAEAAVDLCEAHSAGISVLEGEHVRWEAVAGALEPARGDTVPRLLSPCGVSIDRKATQLLHLPDRCFPTLPAEPRFVEALIVPFQQRRTSVGTVWLVSHSADRKFDREDERVVRVLAEFASAGCQLWQAFEAVDETHKRDESGRSRNPIHDAKLDIKRVNLWSIITEAVEGRRRWTDRRVIITLGNEPIWINADAVRLRQVLSKLIDHAASVKDDSPVALGSSVTDAEVDISIDRTDRRLPEDARIAAGDSAAGVSAIPCATDDFEPELSWIRSLTELHGGAFTVVTREAGRSSFRVRLPLPPQRRHERTPTQS
jgi:hypothetical protein